jgi:hypothetical protein
MKMSKPSPSTMHEYLLYYGEEKVMEMFDMNESEIDDLLYGSALPTKERQNKKKAKAKREDSQRKAFILSMFERDHFLWDTPNSKHIRCQNAKEKILPEWSDKFLEKWTAMYLDFIEKDMKYNNNGLTDHGWSLGERIINKTTSKTTDDCIHDRFLNMLNLGSVFSKNAVKYIAKRDHMSGINQDNVGDETFFENISNTELDHIKSVSQSLVSKNIKNNTY